MTSAHRGYVFLAEDDTDFRQTVQSLLELEGYLVLSARNAKEALARMCGFRSISAALAIVDLSRPLTNGRVLIAAMRADRALAHIPILAVSNYGQQSDAHADRVLARPFPPHQLISTVAELLSEHTAASRRRSSPPTSTPPSTPPPAM
ncbi:MAG TPA: response regulator [Polyangiaceae bacterium]|nr:response regulator [Polyangiaceae bacterium]